eukprot:m.922947 g.922947  ORF g.922947 m.922947 type:complete len:75 (+) comp23763_c0_seq1:1991-2215(+)
MFIPPSATLRTRFAWALHQNASRSTQSQAIADGQGNRAYHTQHKMLKAIASFACNTHSNGYRVQHYRPQQYETI